MTPRLAAVASRAAPIAAGLALVGLLPLAISDFRASSFSYVAIYAIAIVGLNVLTGYTGQISLGHGAFMAIGGYTTAILVAKHGVPYYWTIPLAGLVAGGGGFVAGIPALRISGLHLALATFGLAVATPAFVKHFGGFTGGSTGLGFTLVKAPSGTGLSQNRWLYYLCFGCAFLALAAAWLLLRGRLGRALRAVRDSEVAAASFGIHLAVHKTLAFGVSAAFAGVAGSLYAIANLSYVSPDTYRIDLSLLLVVGAVIAGLGSLWGTAVGALLVEFLSAGDVERWLHVSKSVPADVFFGCFLILVVLALPTGAAGLLERAARALTTRLYTRPRPR